MTSKKIVLIRELLQEILELRLQGHPETSMQIATVNAEKR